LATDFNQNVSWDDAIEELVIEKRASKRPRTARFYQIQLTSLRRWAGEKEIELVNFRIGDYRRYMAYRLDVCKVMPATRRHDAIAARVFFDFCYREEYVSKDVFKDQEIPKMVKKARYCPTPEEIVKLIKASQDLYDPNIHIGAKFLAQPRRIFLKRRNYAIITGLVTTAMRIGEMLDLEIGDVDMERKVVTIRVTKSNEANEVPISDLWIKIVKEWLATRPEIESKILFVSSTGHRLEVPSFDSDFRRLVAFSKVNEKITPHSLRHYSLTAFAKTDVLAAQKIAGHHSLAVTQGYLHVDADYVREQAMAAAPLENLIGSHEVMSNKRSQAAVATRKRII